MNKLLREDLYSLETYDAMRDDYRRRVIAHKKCRVIAIGPNATFHFEDRLTMQYQVQEMLRAERIFSADGIDEELAVYNPLIPDGDNWKATFMIEIEDAQARHVALRKMVGIENRVWVRVDGLEAVYAIADEDLERATEDKTSSVHFLRFPLDPVHIEAVAGGADISVGIDHPAYTYEVAPLPAAARDSLAADLKL